MRSFHETNAYDVLASCFVNPIETGRFVCAISVYAVHAMRVPARGRARDISFSVYVDILHAAITDSHEVPPPVLLKHRRLIPGRRLHSHSRGASSKLALPSRIRQTNQRLAIFSRKPFLFGVKKV
ncbi:hypothetical protein [Massilia sp. YIM B04103]|uniref:hypothetical protein n=1 Tax=Massilia sp. YIM B04103 TaxID=2963106 RepID=UPI0021093CCA|nr:hypothetical protein [Massilia sp. YIM B04103]